MDHLERPGLLMALQLGVLATGLAYLLYGYGLQRLSSATTVTLVLAEPLTATVPRRAGARRVDRGRRLDRHRQVCSSVC